MQFNKRLFLFWKIGESVFKEQKKCVNAIKKYSDLLSYHYGMDETFSVMNIHFMKRFYCCFPIYINEFNKLSFEHYKLLVMISEVQKRYFYFRIALFCRSSVEELTQFIKRDLYTYI